MQLGKKNKAGSMFDQVKNEFGADAEANAPLISPPPADSRASAAASSTIASGRTGGSRISNSADREAVHTTISETISAKINREGTLESFDLKGIMHLRITDASLTQVKLALALGNIHGAQLSTHPKIDKTVFKNNRVLQLADASRGGFPTNSATPIMRWTLNGRVEEPPLAFTVWVNPGTSANTYSVAVEYEWHGGKNGNDADADALRDVSVSIPFQSAEPTISSFDATYEVGGDSIDWTIGSVDDSSASGSFEFEAQAESDAEFFPMTVRFARVRPFVDVDVSRGHDSEVFLNALYLVAVFQGLFPLMFL